MVRYRSPPIGLRVTSLNQYWLRKATNRRNSARAPLSRLSTCATSRIRSLENASNWNFWYSV